MHESLPAQRSTVLAGNGFSVGGTPTYGFVRALVDERTHKVVEVLTNGKRVRQAGCHVMWLPDPADDGVSPSSKLRIRTQLLQWREEGWGYKRMSNALNQMCIPSPNAGASRHNRGAQHFVEGLWHHNTVKNLVEDPLMVALFQYGVRSEGKHRRLGPTGPRFIVDSDHDQLGKTKVIKNDPSLRIRRDLPFEPKFDRDRWEKIQLTNKERGASQRSIPRAKDPSRYPLACRITDLTNDCGSVMYGRTSEGRTLYTCGRYMKYGTHACDNNQVDGEAILSFTLLTIREMIDRLGARDALRQKLLARAKQDAGASDADPTAARRTQLVARKKELEQKKKSAMDNFSFATDQELRAAVHERFLQIKQELEDTETALATLHIEKKRSLSIEEEVDRAMEVLNHTDRLSKEPDARADLHQLFQTLGLQIGLRFVQGKKGENTSRPASCQRCAFA